MAIKRTSNLLWLLFVGVATLFLAAEAVRVGPVTIGPVTIRPAAALDLCLKTSYPDLCASSVKSKSNPFKAVLSNINKTIFLAKQAKVVANQNSNPRNKELIEGCITFFDSTIDDLSQSVDFLRTKDIPSLQSYLSSAVSNTGTCKDQFDEMEGIPFPPALAQVCTTLSHMTGNSLVLTDFLH